MVKLFIVSLAEELAILDGVEFPGRELLLTSRARKTLQVVELQERKFQVIEGVTLI